LFDNKFIGVYFSKIYHFNQQPQTEKLIQMLDLTIKPSLVLHQ